MVLLTILFFLTAALYASVGFGGGSTYNALLVLHGTDYRILPSIALICNILVVAGGVWRFAAAGSVRLARIAPWIAASMPFAWLGGRIPVSETVFVGLLGGALAAAGLRLLLQREWEDPLASRPQSWRLALPIGAALGFFSGITGIGGGIFLAPVLHLLRWDNARAIAGTCSLFILVNSASGLAGQVAKLSDLALLGELAAYWALFPAVIVGGQLGSLLGSRKLSGGWLRKLTAALVLYAAIRLLLRWSELMSG